MSTSYAECLNEVRDVAMLRLIVRELRLSATLVGLADPPAGGADLGEPPVNRREFLEASAAAVVSATGVVGSGLLPSGTVHGRAIRDITASYRLVDGDTPPRDMFDAVDAHLRLATRKHAAARDPGASRSLATGISEIAGFAGWLCWDMHDLGSARMYYSTAINAAAASANSTLLAYMLGSLAALTVNEGNVGDGVRLLRSARAKLGPERPAVATAWLSALEAVAQAGARNERATWQALDRADEAVRDASFDGPVSWPWVFRFDLAEAHLHAREVDEALMTPSVREFDRHLTAAQR
ncbi:MAG: hypothetical protein HY241_17545 [Actinobacteria bacterium]|nr:hypothetical protein [Actinomycetota bacterium]